MRVVCENCGATYKIPEHKLAKEVNKATCRKCGHRMLIRRPTNATPPPSAPSGPSDERTLVAGAVKIEQQPAPPARQAPPPQVGPTGWPAPRGPDGPDAWADEAPTQVQPNSPYASGQPMAAAPARPVVAPFPGPAAQPAPQPMQAAATRVPEPRPVQPQTATQRRAPPRHDPAGDLTWAVVGSFLAVAGALILAINFDGGEWQRFFGLSMTLMGALTALFVVVTGARGRGKARLVVSVVLAGFFSILGALGIHAAYIGLQHLSSTEGLASLSTTSHALAPTQAPAASATVPTPAPPPTAEERSADETIAELLADDEPTEEVVEEPPPEPPAEHKDAVASPPPAAAPATTSRSSGSSSGSSTSRSSGSATSSAAPSSYPSSYDSSRSASSGSSRSTPSDSSSSRGSSGSSTTERAPTTSERSSSTPTATRSTTPPAAEKGKMAKLPLTVVDTIIRSNKGIKKCFYEEKQRTGSYPSRVDVKVTILGNGSVNSARVSTSQYRGTELDSCLGSAFKTLAFPQFDGDAVTMTYPFVL